jgi:DNA-binding NarL/FixJ family response regulator
MRVVLVDNHALVRAGLRLLLSAESDIAVVADVDSGEEALEAVARHSPDVVVMDLSMPGMSGLECTRHLAGCAPRTRILVLTRFIDYAHMREAIEAGASGYVLKSASASQLVEALRAVGEGRFYIDPGVQLPASVRAPDDIAESSPAPADRIAGLSAREHEVLRAAAAGESTKQIANRLMLSTRTVEFHKYKAMRRLGLRGRAALLRFALEMGWLRPSGE